MDWISSQRCNIGRSADFGYFTTARCVIINWKLINSESNRETQLGKKSWPYGGKSMFSSVERGTQHIIWFVLCFNKADVHIISGTNTNSWFTDELIRNIYSDAGKGSSKP